MMKNAVAACILLENPPTAKSLHVRAVDRLRLILNTSTSLFDILAASNDWDSLLFCSGSSD
jgi:hypothetical protein